MNSVQRTVKKEKNMRQKANKIALSIIEYGTKIS